MSKIKGCNAERELIHMFWNSGWAAIRIAGSGSSRYPSADIIASNKERILAIEAKTTKNDIKYFSQQEIEELKKFSEKFGAELWIAIKFSKIPWVFLKIENLLQSGSSLSFSKKRNKSIGLSFNEVISLI